MTKVAVVFADGCEEVEGLSVVDVLRRLNIDCDMVGLDKKKLMVIIISYLPVIRLWMTHFLIMILLPSLVAELAL